MSDMGENLPTYRPPLNSAALFGEPRLGERGDLSVAVRYLTPHNKWSILRPVRVWNGLSRSMFTVKGA
jgi:nitrate reductase alpha subunit